jgi:2-C-methyl-D-erythritol 4-phosphate cytidylyltransferase
MGLRAAGCTPKQFIEIGGKPIIAYSIDKFQKSVYVNRILVVVPEGYMDTAREITAKYAYDKVTAVICGGPTRQASVYGAVLYVEQHLALPRYILIHDAARPFVTENDIEAVVKGIGVSGCAVAACGVTDTIKQTRNGTVTTPDRKTLFAAQTPQGFEYKLLLQAHKQAAADNCEYSDDSSLTERLGINTNIIDCGRRNFKITTKEDIITAQRLLTE